MKRIMNAKLRRRHSSDGGDEHAGTVLAADEHRSLLAFFLLAFALSWWPWPLVLLNPNSLTLIPWSPLVAALIMAAVGAGRRGLKDLLSRTVRWRVGWRWYGVALLLPVAITVLAASLNVLLGPAAPTAADFSDWYTLPLVLLITFFVKGPLTEEVAWRGFALPRLLNRMSPIAASLLACSLGSSGLCGTCRSW